MPIDFTCPHCGHHTSVAEQYAGQTGPCSSCGKSIAIPAAEADPASGAPAPSAKRTSGAFIALIVVIGVLVIGCMISVPVALLLPAVQAAREAARRAECSNNLKQISLAMLTYESVHRSFPPAYLADENGRPMHSWRVLILPYMSNPQAESIYARYNLDEPWDSPANLALADEIPSVYTCSSSAGAAQSPPAAHYAIVTGPNYAFYQDRAPKISDFRDGTSNTILVVETTGLVTAWTEPVDIDSVTKSDAINDPGQLGISSAHPRGANVAFADGSVHFIEEFTSPLDVDGLLTPAGGEEVDPLSY